MSSSTQRKRPSKKTTKNPGLVRLKYGTPYCELCKRTISVGEPVAWWRVGSAHGIRPAAYCSDCHHANVRAGRALR